MNVKDFKAGIVAGAKPFEDKFREIQNANIASLQILACENANEVGELIDISEEHDCLLNYDWKKEYELSSYAEKGIFLGFLKYCIDLMETVPPTDEQKSFLNNLYKLFKINPFGVKGIEISKLANNRDVGFQNLLYINICIYCFLSNDNFEFEKKYTKEIFDYFSVSPKEKDDIRQMIKWTASHLNLVAFFHEEESQNDEIQEIECKESIINKITTEEECPAKNIEREVAQIFFNKYCDSKHLCTNSYIISLSDSNENSSKLISIDKESGEKKLLMECIDKDVFEKNLITSFNDYLIFFHNFELCLMDVKNGTLEKLILEFEKKSLKVENIGNVKTNGKIVAFTDASSIKYVELETLTIHEIQTDITFEAINKFVIYKDYIIFLRTTLGKDGRFGYEFDKYNTRISETTTLSQKFSMEKLGKKMFEVYEIGIHEDTLFVILSWKFMSISPESRDGFDCYKCDLKRINDSRIENFYIWHKYIYDLYKYNEFLIYNNASKNYSLTKHSIISDGKKIIKTKYGHDEKSSFSDRFIFGKEMYHKPRKYYHLENWLLLLEGFEEKLVDINSL